MTTGTSALTCRDVSDFLGEYFAEALEPHARGRFEEHLAACPDCQAYVRQYRMTQRLAKAAFDTDARDAGVPEELVRAILEARPRASGPPDDPRPSRRRR